MRHNTIHRQTTPLLLPNLPHCRPPWLPSLPHSPSAISGSYHFIVTLSISQKMEVVKEHKFRVEQGRIVKQSDLCSWAQNKFKLKKPPNQSTISRIIKDSSCILIDNISQSINSRNAAQDRQSRMHSLHDWLTRQPRGGKYPIQYCVSMAVVLPRRQIRSYPSTNRFSSIIRG